MVTNEEVIIHEEGRKLSMRTSRIEKLFGLKDGEKINIIKFSGYSDDFIYVETVYET